MLNKFLRFSIPIFLLPFFLFAQTINMPFTLSNELGVDINPTYPRPNERTSINLSMFTENLDSSNIVWIKNGETVLSGRGQKSYSFVMGKVGEETNIEIQITLMNGVSFSRKMSFNPASVDILWEAQSYTHPFYKGKALHPKQGLLKLIAMPEFYKDGKKIPEKELIYEWRNGLSAIQNQSGYGKDTAWISGSLLGRDERIEVIVTDPVNGITANAFLNISPIEPELIFYENNPFYGHLFDNAIKSSHQLKGEELQIYASPLYLSSEDFFSVNFDWKLNGKSITNLRGSNTAIFRKPETAGRSNVSLNIENSKKILQFATKSVSINFEN